MSAVVIPFARTTRCAVQHVDKAADRPPMLTKGRADQHLPLIEAALELLQIDDVEFERRCRLMTDAEGRSLLDDLTAQLDRLGTHITNVVEALGMTATRIRATMAAAG